MDVFNIRDRDSLNELVKFCIAKTHLGKDRINIAGGALRDSIYGKEIRDVDMYLVCTQTSFTGKAVIEQFKLEQKGEEYEGADFTVWHNPKTLPGIDVIFVAPNGRRCPQKVIEKFVRNQFDCSICEVWYNFKTGLHYTDAFEDTRVTGVITCDEHNFNTEHIQRVKDKYPVMHWSVTHTPGRF